MRSRMRESHTLAPSSAIHSSGPRRRPRRWNASCVAVVVLPLPGNPQTRMRHPRTPRSRSSRPLAVMPQSLPDHVLGQDKVGYGRLPANSVTAHGRIGSRKDALLGNWPPHASRLSLERTLETGSQTRSLSEYDELIAWQPPGGGAAGALSHAVIHSLDVTIALDRPAVAPAEAAAAVLDQLTAASGTWFGVDLTGVRLVAADIDWSWGNGQLVRANSGSLVALLSGRALPDGRTLPRG